MIQIFDVVAQLLAVEFRFCIRFALLAVWDKIFLKQPSLEKLASVHQQHNVWVLFTVTKTSIRETDGVAIITSPFSPVKSIMQSL